MMKWILFFIFLLISILLLSGKGGFLIAGYNTASEKEKAAYNFKRLSLVMGGGMSVITVLYLLTILLDQSSAFHNGGILGVGVMVVVLLMAVLTNTICRSKDPLYQQEITPAEQKNQKLYMRVTVIFISIVSVFVCVALFTGDVTVQFQQDFVTMDVPISRDGKVYYQDIKNITLRDELDIGSRRNGVGSPRLQAGNFKNKAFGDYLLYSYTNCSSYIVVETDSNTVVFNGKDAAQTKELFKKLKEKLQ